jgi:hypothetical protein
MIENGSFRLYEQDQSVLMLEVVTNAVACLAISHYYNWNFPF